MRLSPLTVGATAVSSLPSLSLAFQTADRPISSVSSVIGGNRPVISSKPNVLPRQLQSFQGQCWGPDRPTCNLPIANGGDVICSGNYQNTISCNVDNQEYKCASTEGVAHFIHYDVDCTLQQPSSSVTAASASNPATVIISEGAPSTVTIPASTFVTQPAVTTTIGGTTQSATGGGSAVGANLALLGLGILGAAYPHF